MTVTWLQLRQHCDCDATATSLRRPYKLWLRLLCDCNKTCQSPSDVFVILLFTFDVWPTMSCFADWSKCSHVTLIIIIWSTRHGRPCVIIMINGHVTAYHYNDTRSREIWWPWVENVALGLRTRATFSTSGSSYFNVHSLPCIICIMSISYVIQAP